MHGLPTGISVSRYPYSTLRLVWSVVHVTKPAPGRWPFRRHTTAIRAGRGLKTRSHLKSIELWYQKRCKDVHLGFQSPYPRLPCAIASRAGEISTGIAIGGWGLVVALALAFRTRQIEQSPKIVVSNVLRTGQEGVQMEKLSSGPV